MPPAAIIVGLAVAGAAAGAAAAASGKNRNDYKGDRNAPSTRNGAEDLGFDANRRERLGNDAQGREGAQLDNTLGDQSRMSQMDALEMYRQAALGNAPSVAQLQMKQALDESVRNQAAMASGARGQSALALAGQNAAVNTALLHQGTAMNSSVLRAQEIDAARAGYGGMASGIRGYDESRSATQAGLDDANLNRNDQYQLGMYGQAAGLSQAEVQARTAQNQQALAVWQYQDDMSRKENDDARAARNQNFADVMGGAQGGAMMGANLSSGGAAGAAAGAAGKIPPPGGK